MGELFGKERDAKQGWCENHKLEELTPKKGDSIGFYLVETPMIDGDDGAFMAVKGLLIDLESKTVGTLVKSAKPVSFIPKSILEGDITEGNWNIGELARLENSNRPGDKNAKGIKTRYFAWKVFIQDISVEIKNALDEAVVKFQGKDIDIADKPDV